MQNSPVEILANDIHLWFVHSDEITDSNLMEQYILFLNNQERHQQEKFYFQKHQDQYLITRALVRSVLTLYHPDIEPQEWEFSKNKFGRPFIQNPLPTALNFNISHTDKIIVLAISTNPEIGIDVENINRVAKYMETAAGNFTQSELAYLKEQTPDQQRMSFFELWTLKEAYIKAKGMGLSISLDKLSFSFDESKNIGVKFAPSHKDDETLWKFWQFQPTNSHVVSLAARQLEAGEPFNISMRKIIPTFAFDEVNYLSKAG